MGLRKKARTFAAGQVALQYGKEAGDVAYEMFKKVSAKERKAAVAPGTLLAGTKLKSYLDRRYARKCGVEVKNYRYLPSPVTLNNNLSEIFNPLEATIPQGLTDSTRIGDRVEIKNIRFKFFANAGVASTIPVTCRLIWVKVGTSTGTNPVSSQILNSIGNIRSDYQDDNDVNREFTIVKDMTFRLDALSSGRTNTGKTWSWTYKPKGCHSLEFTTADTTGVLANITHGNFICYGMFESLPGGVVAPSVSIYAHINYIDI